MQKTQLLRQLIREAIRHTLREHADAASATEEIAHAVDGMPEAEMAAEFDSMPMDDVRKFLSLPRRDAQGYFSSPEAWLAAWRQASAVLYTRDM